MNTKNLQIFLFGFVNVSCNEYQRDFLVVLWNILSKYNHNQIEILMLPASRKKSMSITDNTADGLGHGS